MRLFSSLSFRLALLYVLLFSASLTALIAMNYWLAVARPLAAIEAQVRAEADDLADSYIVDSREIFLARLRAREKADAGRKAFYAFKPPGGGAMITNLPNIPQHASGDLVRIEADIYVDGDEEDHMALAIDRQFRTGARLIVGRDIEDIFQHEELLEAAVPWTLGVSVFLGIVGGVVMSFAIGRRIEAVSSTARTVIAGDLSGRVPVRGSGDDFDRLGATFNLMLDRIDAGMQAVHRVSDHVAHELRTPLARMQTLIDRTRRLRGQGNHDMAEMLSDQLVEEGERLQAIFDALLRISRIESGVHAISFAEVDAVSLLRDVVDLYLPAAEQKGIDFRLVIEGEPLLRGDADLLAQGLCNLVDNAIKYTPDNGRVEVRLSAQPSGRATIAVEDDGPGIDPASADKLTERFFRSPDVTHIEGSGLGLALVQAVATAHRSDLSFASDGQGMRVAWRF